MIRWTPFLLLGFLICQSLISNSAKAQVKTDFAHDVLPILQQRCAKCHSNGTYKGGFSIDSRDALIETGAVDFDDPQSSEILSRIGSADPEYQMPPEGARLTAEQTGAFSKWIEDDLVWEPGFTFKKSKWIPPITPRRVVIPKGESNPVDAVLKTYLFDGPLPTDGKLVSDQVYIRRVFMDLIGVLPTLEQQNTFFNDQNIDKRSKLVQNLLNRDRDYADHWMTFWNDLLRNDYAGTGYIDGGRKQVSKWLHQSLTKNIPYDQFVRELIDPKPESEGFIRGIKWRGNVNASQITEVQFAQNVTQVFLGENLKCASCHDSFIDDWKLKDAYGMAAIIADKPLEMFRCDVSTGETAQAAFLWPQLGTIDPNQSKKERLTKTAEIITDPNNGRFARTIVNRIWQRLMGQGIVEPVDMMSNRPFCPELLDFLGMYLQEQDYDLKKLMLLIATSEAYQSRSVSRVDSKSSDTWSGPIARRLTAEQFVDAVWLLTESGPSKANAPIEISQQKPAPRIRASLVVSDNLMRSLGRPNREQVVTTRPDQISTLQALDLSNGKPLFDLVNRGAKKYLTSAQTNRTEFVKQFFQKAVCRIPTESEVKILFQILGEKPTAESVADLIWTVFMMPEFQYVR